MTRLTAADRGSVRALRATTAIAAALIVVPLVGSRPDAARAATSAPGGEFLYRARPGDTLIGLGRRLLRDPRRWRDVRSLNHVADARRIPLGYPLRIPYDWLRLEPETATVESAAGTVRRDGRAVRSGARVGEGSRLETGPDGSVTLDLADGSVITLQKSSALRLRTLRQVTGVRGAHDTQLQLEAGRLQSIVRPHGDTGRFEIVTPTAVAAVRGTRFRTAFDARAGDATAETLEGDVAVSGAGSRVDVPSGFGTRIERGAAPIRPVRLLPAPRLAAGPLANGGPRLDVRWPPVAGASRYRFQLAPDPGFHSISIDQLSSAAEVDVPAPADGDYWLRVRAIDALGLEGLDAVARLSQHRPPPRIVRRLGAPTPHAPRLSARVLRLDWDARPNRRYHIQIARDAAFSRLLLDRTLDVPALTMRRPRPGAYYARVQTIDSQGADPFGAVREFEVPVPRWLRILLPIAALLPLVFA